MDLDGPASPADIRLRKHLSSAQVSCTEQLCARAGRALPGSRPSVTSGGVAAGARPGSPGRQTAQLRLRPFAEYRAPPRPGADLCWLKAGSRSTRVHGARTGYSPRPAVLGRPCRREGRSAGGGDPASAAPATEPSAARLTAPARAGPRRRRRSPVVSRPPRGDVRRGPTRAAPAGISASSGRTPAPRRARSRGASPPRRRRAVSARGAGAGGRASSRARGPHMVPADTIAASPRPRPAAPRAVCGRPEGPAWRPRAPVRHLVSPITRDRPARPGHGGHDASRSAHQSTPLRSVSRPHPRTVPSVPRGERPASRRRCR